MRHGSSRKRRRKENGENREDRVETTITPMISGE
jgi:hypothetical protein